MDGLDAHRKRGKYFASTKRSKQARKPFVSSPSKFQESQTHDRRKKIVESREHQAYLKTQEK